MLLTKRTIHPLHSVAIYSKNSSKKLKHLSHSSFGKNSIWEWFSTSKNVCNVALGLDLDGGATFCHFAEEFLRVNYRQYVNLPGKVYDKRKKLIKKNIYILQEKRIKK